MSGLVLINIFRYTLTSIFFPLVKMPLCFIQLYFVYCNVMVLYCICVMYNNYVSPDDFTISKHLPPQITIVVYIDYTGKISVF